MAKVMTFLLAHLIWWILTGSISPLQVTRLEAQVKRYKTDAERAEGAEDDLKQEKRKLQKEVRILNLQYLFSTYINMKMSVCLFVRIFLGHLESDWDTLWQKVGFRPRKGSKTIKFQKKLFSAELLPFFYISLRFLCKFEERL